MAVYLNAGQLSNCKVCNVFLGKKSRRLRGAPTPLSRGQATPASVATLRPIIRNENGHPSNWGISFTVYTVLCYRGGREPWAPAASPAKSGVRLRHSRPAGVCDCSGGRVGSDWSQIQCPLVGPAWQESLWLNGDHFDSHTCLLCRYELKTYPI